MKDGLIIKKSELGNKDRWEKIYLGEREEIPWDVGNSSKELSESVESITPCFALDVGCGTGTEAIYLAKRGFKVSAVDISETAIQIAKDKAKKENVNIDFKVGSVLNIPFDSNVFGFVNDRGCFHAIEPKDREKFTSEINRVLKSGGLYLMLCFSNKEPENDKGPYRFSEMEIRNIFSRYFVIKQIQAIKLYGKNIAPNEGYSCLMSKKIKHNQEEK